MSDLLLELVDMNENIDYGIFVKLFCSYILLLWIVISAWVGMDARKRFNKKYAILFFLLVLVLNFPMLIFYFIIRPEEQYEYYDQWDLGGVNVPLVNFVGKEGVEMVLELKLNPSKVTSKIASDMKIDVSWDSPKEDMKLVTSPVGSVMQDKPDQRIETSFSHISGLVQKRIKKIKEILASYKKWRRNDKQSPKEGLAKKEITKQAEQLQRKQVPNKKKNKNKKKKK